MGGIHPVFLHGVEHLGLVVLGYLVDGIKALPKVLQDLFAKFIYSGADAQLRIHCIQFHKNHPFRVKFSTNRYYNREKEERQGNFLH